MTVPGKEATVPRKLYLETRLYNINDRLASLDLCEHIDQWIDEGLLADMEHCFLPYRDSNNTLDDNVKDTGQAIFDTDITCLKQCEGVVGYFDGIHYDSGCAFEIGCGYAWGYPVNLISTDFHKWSVGDSSEFYVASRLLEHLAVLTYIPDSDMKIKDYRRQQEDFRERVLADFKGKLIEQYGTVRPGRRPLEALDVVYDFYLDPNFQYTEPGRELLKKIIDVIEGAGKTWVAGDNQGDPDTDIERLRMSKRAVFYDDYFEFNVDSGLLHGIAYGIGRPPVVYSSNSQRSISDGGENWLNVMIRYSADAVVKSVKELEEFIKCN